MSIEALLRAAIARRGTVMIITSIGGGTISALESFGRFWTFAIRTGLWIGTGMLHPRNWRLLMTSGSSASPMATTGTRAP